MPLTHQRLNYSFSKHFEYPLCAKHVVGTIRRRDARAPATEGNIKKNLTLLRGEQASRGLLVTEKTHSTRTVLMGEIQVLWEHRRKEGFLEGVTSELWKKSGVCVFFFYQKVTLAANEGLAGILTEAGPARKLWQCCSSKWGAACSPSEGGGKHCRWWQVYG